MTRNGGLATLPGKPFDFSFDGYYRINGLGVAWNVFDFETEPDEDTEWSGYEIPTGRVVAHMVGDDRVESFDPEDLTPIGDEDFCRDCGQIGCGHNVYV